MPSVFIVEDSFHAELGGKFSSYNDALQELKRRAEIPWDAKPNVCPCMNWKNCGRRYEIIEYNDATKPWSEVSREQVMEISSRGVVWLNSG